MVLVGPVAVLDDRLARRHAGSRDFLSDQRARHRLRHHLLLGRADDHDGAQVRRRRAVPGGLHARPDPRRGRAEDVEVQGQRARPAGPDRRHRSRVAGREAHERADAAGDGAQDREVDARRVSQGHSGRRHRRAAVHVRRAGDHRARHQLRPEPHRGLPQLLQQALERSALRADERRRGPSRAAGPGRAEPPGSLDPVATRAHHRLRRGQPAALPHGPGREGVVRIYVERVL